MQPRERLKQTVIIAWRSGATHERLLELLLSGEATPAGHRQAYDLLQEIWLEAGYDESDEQSALRQELEIALERTWYGSPAC